MPPAPPPRSTLEELFDGCVDALEQKGVSECSSTDRQTLCQMLESYLQQAGGAHEDEEEADEDEEEEEETMAPTSAVVDRKLVPQPTAVAFFKRMSTMQQTLRGMVPYGSITENVVPPRRSTQFDADVPFYDIDSFLFDDADLDGFVDAGLVHRFYCVQCSSSNHLKPTQFISHSFSEDQLLYFARFLLPALATPKLLQRKSAQKRGGAVPPLHVVDVGSRLGVVCAASTWALRQACRAIAAPLVIRGVEVSREYCDVQRRYFAKAGLRAPEVDVVLGDATKVGSAANDAVRAADIVVMNNVFEWFLPFDEQLEAWRSIRAATKGRPGTILIISPPLDATLKPLFFEEWTAEKKAQPPKSKAHRSEEKQSAAKDESDAQVSAFLQGWVDRIDTAEIVSAYMAERAEADSGESVGDVEHARESLVLLGAYRVL